jgi:hypothetical protein
MDEVKAMARAGETVGKAVGTGLLVVRRGAQRAGQAGAEATVRAAHVAEQKLAERGVAPKQLTEALAEGAEVAREEVAKTTRRTRRKLARTAKSTRKELGKAAKQARKNTAKSKPVKSAKRSAKQAKQDAEQLKQDAKQLKTRLKADAEDLRTRAREGAESIAAAKADAKARIKAAKEAAKEAGKPKRRRRWPMVIGVAALGAGVAYAMRAKPEPVPEVVPEPRHRTDEGESTDPAAKPTSAKAGAQDKDETSGDGQRNGQAKPGKPATKRG